MSAVPEVRAVDCRALKQVYQKMGLTGRDVARLVNIHPSAVSRWASGERNPSLLQLMRLTTKLGVPFWQIATTYEDEPTSQDAPRRPKRRPVAPTSTSTGRQPATPANDDLTAVTSPPA
jgi:transcriptional regulator with XRE-family HTH domain